MSKTPFKMEAVIFIGIQASGKSTSYELAKEHGFDSLFYVRTDGEGDFFIEEWSDEV